MQWVSKVRVQFNFSGETRDKVTSRSEILKYRNLPIWFLSMYNRYSNMYIMLYDCSNIFALTFLSQLATLINLVLYIKDN